MRVGCPWVYDNELLHVSNLDIYYKMSLTLCASGPAFSSTIPFVSLIHYVRLETNGPCSLHLCMTWADHHSQNSLIDAAAVAVQSLVLPSICSVPNPALPIAART